MEGKTVLERVSMISFWDEASAHGASDSNGFFDWVSGFVTGRRARQRTLAHYNHLIEHADQHMLNDLGVSRSDLFRMREALFDR
jgi:hypothetical protein